MPLTVYRHWLGQSGNLGCSMSYPLTYVGSQNLRERCGPPILGLENVAGANKYATPRGKFCRWRNHMSPQIGSTGAPTPLSWGGGTNNILQTGALPYIWVALPKLSFRVVKGTDVRRGSYNFKCGGPSPLGLAARRLIFIHFD